MSEPIPDPRSPRWQPLRGGLLNLFRYEEQEFRYTNGRLLLRGNNGTGKSRVLALQLPFLLDGEISSRRVEPDADPAKRMIWNVLTDDHDNRTGYTWLEFGRIGEDGAPRVLTLGCGLHGVRGRDLKRWYFITTRRVGLDLFLRSEERVPISRERLREALGEQGTLFEGVREYRQAVNDHLFQLPAERYEALLALLIQLRQPQLSRQLDEQRLSDALGNALAPLDPGLISQVAESFRQIEADRDALRNDERAVVAVNRFRELYGRYARAVSVRRAGDLRECHNRYESAQRDANAAGEKLREARETLKARQDRLRECREQLTGARSEEQALNADPVMKTAQRLERLAGDTREAEMRADTAARELEDCRGEVEERARQRQKALEEAEACAARARALRERGAKESRTLGAGSSFDRLSFENPAALGDEADSLRRTLEEAMRRLVELDARHRECREAERRAAEAAAQQRERQEQCLVAVGERTRKLQEVRDAHLEAVDAWLSSLRVLDLPMTGELLDAESMWSETLSGEEPLLTALDLAHRELRNTTAVERAGLELAQRKREEQRGLLQSEQRELEAGADRIPPPPYPRTAGARTDREGAPFWQCVEFRPELDEAQRPCLEAALEASGLLDAWLPPRGGAPRTADGDMWLNPDTVPVLESGSLADWLIPDPAAGIPRDAVNAVLRRIAIEPNDHPVGVDAQGGWRNGLLSGRWEKHEAEYIGAASRERARQTRIRQIESEIGELEREMSRGRDALEALRVRDLSADREAERRPSPESLREEDRALRAEKDHLEKERERLAEREEALRTKRKESSDAERIYRETGEDLGMTAWLDRLEDLREALGEFGRLLERLRAACGEAVRCGELRERANFEYARVQKRLVQREEQREQSAESAVRLRREYDTLRETAGRDVLEIQSKLEKVRLAIAGLEADIREADKLERKADKQLTIEETRHGQLAEELQTRTGEREAARESFARFAELGLLREADMDPKAVSGMAEWSITRMVEFVRALARDWGESVGDEELDRTTNAMTRGFQDLQTALSPQNHLPVSEQHLGVSIVTCEFQGARRSMRDLHEGLSIEVVERKKILDAKEREFIETYLVGEVADQLHRLIVGARELIRDMNTEIERCAMSTGMRLRLKWTPSEDAPPGLKQAEASLARAQTLLTPEERDQLAGFLQDRIEQEKRENEGGTWTEHLENAVDYRRWHRFSIEREQNGKWTKLTRRTHGTGSGGEKAMMLTIPQFAAAAAHYHAIPHAPRLIMLDEAFVGIDADMRGKCMGLIRHFDLDVVMTSEREWGCYESIDGLSICQLATHPASKAIAVSHWRWNGRIREKFEVKAPAAPAAVREPENELFAPPGDAGA